MRVSIKLTADRVAALNTALAKLAANHVLVGIPAEKTARASKANEPQGMTNAALGYIHDNGSPAANIPARPWLRPGIRDVKPEIIARYRAGARAILDGRIADADQVHTSVGLIAEKGVKAKITDGDFAPLAPRTVAARKARGRSSTKPLVDTGQLRAAVTHVIRSAPKR
jgi:hypothetical protein